VMTSRERVSLALQHKEADRVPLDLGASAVTGMQVDTVYGLRQALGLDRPGEKAMGGGRTPAARFRYSRLNEAASLMLWHLNGVFCAGWEGGA
jgi:hypothetical protein